MLGLDIQNPIINCHRNLVGHNFQQTDHLAMGQLADDPGEIVSLLREWLRPGNSELDRMARNAHRLAQPETTLEIARLIADLC